MKIIAWKVVVEYEDGSERDISLSIPMRLCADIERCLDAIEKEEAEE